MKQSSAKHPLHTLSRLILTPILPLSHLLDRESRPNNLIHRNPARPVWRLFQPGSTGRTVATYDYQSMHIQAQSSHLILMSVIVPCASISRHGGFRVP